METSILIIKILETLFFTIALIYSVKNYRLTKTTSDIWLYISLAMFSAFILSSTRTVKEFWPVIEFEIIEIELIPLIIAFLLAAAVTVRKERGLPRIIPISEPGKVTYCGISHKYICADDMEKQRAAVNKGKKEKCPVRACVGKRDIKSCLDCPEYRDCEIRTIAIDKCQLFIYQLRKGHIYLQKGEDPDESFELFVDLLMRGLKGLCITRTNPERIRKRYNLKKTPIAWLTEIQTTEELTMSPQLEQLLHTIIEFIDKSEHSVILLDGIDYLIQHNNFRRVLHFFHRLRDEIAVSKSRMIITISPTTIGEKELKLLERETDITLKYHNHKAQTEP